MALKIPPLVWFALFAALMWAAGKVLPFAAHGRLSVLAFILSGLGSVIIAMALSAFRRAQTTVNPRQPAETRSLVCNGIYRISRNPMYLGMAFLLAAWALWLGYAAGWLGVVGFVYCLTRFQIVPEETLLHAKFTTAYEHYCRHTRRWL